MSTVWSRPSSAAFRGFVTVGRFVSTQRALANVGQSGLPAIRNHSANGVWCEQRSASYGTRAHEVASIEVIRLARYLRGSNIAGLLDKHG